MGSSDSKERSFPVPRSRLALVHREKARHLHFSSASKLYDYVRSANAPWKRPSFSEWVFRGVNNSRYENIPSAFRFGGLVQEDSGAQVDANLVEQLLKNDWFLRSEREQFRIRLDYLDRHIKKEYEYGHQFWQRSNRAGLTLANDEPPEGIDLIILLYAWLRSGSQGNPFHEVRMALSDPTYALAQHYMVPTRRLDITLNPMVALFFAAYKADVLASSCIALYAYETWHSPGSSFFNKDLPRYKHPYLDAQDGLFETLPMSELHYLEYGCWPSLEDAFLHGPRGAGHFFCLTLPTRETYALRRLLDAEGLTLSRLMPSYETVVKELMEELPRSTELPRD